MKLKIDSIWSPNLIPESSGVPPDTHHFHLYMKIRVTDRESRFKVFNFQVCSPSALSDSESGVFLKHILVLEKFDWLTIKERIILLIAECENCATWEDAVSKLAGSLEYTG
jgi:hypothetical protein